MIRTIVLIVGVLCTAPRLQACECTRIGQACQMAGAEDGVFLGKVVSVSSRPERQPPGYILRNHVTFEVVESFKGVAARTVEVVTGSGDGDCGYGFQKGREYLVYASRNGATTLSTSICSRTAPAEQANSDLAYLRSLAKGGPSARVFGFVTAFQPLLGVALRWTEKAPLPIANVPIRLESQGTSRQTTTDAAGGYVFDGLSAGEFTVSADMPNNLGGGEKRTFRLSEHGCSEQIFVAVERAQLSGRVLDDRQLPLVTTQVSLVPTRGSPKAEVFSSYTYQRGVFTIQRIPPGDYVLGVNISEPPREGRHLSDPFPPTYFPGVTNRAEAKIIHVESGQQLSGFELRIPFRLKQRTITGRVTWPDGKPALGAYVELKDSEFPDSNVDLGHSIKDGTFTVTGVEGRIYSLSAAIGIGEGQRPFHSETIHLKSGENGPLRLVLSLPGR
jgi:hypothetical protein